VGGDIGFRREQRNRIWYMVDDLMLLDIQERGKDCIH